MLHIFCNIILYINQFFATKYIWQLLQNWTALDIKYLKWIILLHCCHKYYSISKVQIWPRDLGTRVIELIWIVTKPVHTLLAFYVNAKIYVQYIKLSGFWITLTLMMGGGYCSRTFSDSHSTPTITEISWLLIIHGKFLENQKKIIFHWRCGHNKPHHSCIIPSLIRLKLTYLLFE